MLSKCRIAKSSILNRKSSTSKLLPFNIHTRDTQYDEHEQCATPQRRPGIKVALRCGKALVKKSLLTVFPCLT